MNVHNIGDPQIVNRAFVALAIEAGIETVIKSLIPLGVSKRELLIKLVETLTPTNPELASALNTDTLDAILKYMMSKAATPIVFAEDLPVQLNENGPASVVAARDGGIPTQVNITFSEPPASYTYEIFFDLVLVKEGDLAGAGGFVNEAIQNIAQDGKTHTIRVLFVSPDLAVTRFGPIASFS